ncbi:HORMA domain [Trypanosoma vivax]|uniref:HORMA domain-containing protein n=1 Tax=Trypanosoma vivax (strain Y486) TaxID=1055687 RepID=G0U6J7_TRYVY|nr:hypothetical protein TRVL_03181 [Trypanosoma vivax]KAH8611510.1 HORMA domain [Trypanosoma vivax]CCC51501.1 conserved hypothetical protein [Trypanosoma vivax Y486]
MSATLTEVTQTQSLAAVRNFIRVTVSCVTYLRGLCSDESYQPRQFLGLHLKQLTRTSPEADTISRWMEDGAFDAINKGYLKELALCIYTPNCCELLESYSFNLSYSQDGQRAALTFAGGSQSGATDQSFGGDMSTQRAVLVSGGQRRRSREEVQQALARVITKIMEVVEALPPLLCERVLTMQLKYHEDVTPPLYEPPCFTQASKCLVLANRKTKNDSMSVATLDTGHHALSIMIRHRFFERFQDQASSPNATPGEVGASLDRSIIPQLRNYGAVLSSNHQVGGTTVLKGTQPAANATKLHNPNEPFQQHLRVYDVAFLVFTSFVITKSPAISRGRVSVGEVADYLRVACPVEIGMDTMQEMMSRLEEKGIVSTETRFEWSVNSHTAASVATTILKEEDVTTLLSAHIRRDLEALASGSKSARGRACTSRKRAR